MDINFDICFRELHDFVIYMLDVKKRKQRTVYDYYMDLLLFWRYMKFLKKKVPPKSVIDDIDVRDIDIQFIKSVTIEDIMQYFDYLRIARNNSERSLVRRASSLKVFFRYLQIVANLIENNPALRIELPAIKKTPPEYIGESDCLTLLRSIKGEYRERDYCIFVIFINCGITLSELVRINDTDIKKNGEVTIHGKNGNTRTIYFNDDCMKAIEKYSKYKEKFFEGKRYDHHAVFINNRGKRMSGRWIEKIVTFRMENAGFGSKKLNPRKLRHSAAKAMYRRGAGIEMLKEILGHEGLGSTENYAEKTDFDIASFMKSNLIGKPLPLSEKDDSSKKK